MRKSFRLAVGLASAVLTLGAAARPIMVSGAWTRPAPAGGNAAVYLTLTNAGRAGDALTAVASPDAARASLHESRMVGQVMTMRALPSVAIAPGASARFLPGGRHVMVEALKRPLKAGGRLTLILTFQHAGAVRVSVPARAAAPPDPMAGMKM